MKNPPLLFFFILSVLALLFGATFFPSLRLVVFAPFFSIVFQRKNLLLSLWIACLCGLAVDLLSVDLRFGVLALCSTATAALTYHFKHYFFEEKLLSIPLYTAVISFVFSAIQFFLSSHLVTFSFQQIFLSLLVMPLVDALYGFVWFTCPRMLYSSLFNFVKRWM